MHDTRCGPNFSSFQLNMDMLLRMQAWYDATEMRKHAGKIKVDPYVAA